MVCAAPARSPGCVCVEVPPEVFKCANNCLYMSRDSRTHSGGLGAFIVSGALKGSEVRYACVFSGYIKLIVVEGIFLTLVSS